MLCKRQMPLCGRGTRFVLRGRRCPRCSSASSLHEAKSYAARPASHSRRHRRRMAFRDHTFDLAKSIAVRARAVPPPVGKEYSFAQVTDVRRASLADGGTFNRHKWKASTHARLTRGFVAESDRHSTTRQYAEDIDSSAAHARLCACEELMASIGNPWPRSAKSNVWVVEE